MSRIGRSIRLVKESYRVLMQDKELLLLPVISGLLVLVVTASFVIPMFLLGGDVEEENGVLWTVVGLAFYIVTYTIGIFFQAAVVAGANERLSGGDPTLGSALGAAARHLGSIVAWGVVAGTVGMILRSIQERSELLGRIVAGLVGAAWSLATFFVVPVLVLEGVGMSGAFKRSWALFKDTWGEQIGGRIGLGLASLLLVLPVLGVCALLWWAGLQGVAVVLGVLSFALLGVFFAALQAVFVTVLYRYATTGETVAGFADEDVAGAFRPKSR
jgi:hypothetical protein